MSFSRSARMFGSLSDRCFVWWIVELEASIKLVVFKLTVERFCETISCRIWQRFSWRSTNFSISSFWSSRRQIFSFVLSKKFGREKSVRNDKNSTYQLLLNSLEQRATRFGRLIHELVFVVWKISHCRSTYLFSSRFSSSSNDEKRDERILSISRDRSKRRNWELREIRVSTRLFSFLSKDKSSVNGCVERRTSAHCITFDPQVVERSRRAKRKMSPQSPFVTDRKRRRWTCEWNWRSIGDEFCCFYSFLDVAQRVRSNSAGRKLRRTRHRSDLQDSSRFDCFVVFLCRNRTREFLFWTRKGYFKKLGQFSFSSSLYFPVLSSHIDDRGVTPVFFRIIPRGQASSLLSEVSSLDLLSIYNVNKLPSDIFKEVQTWL